MNIPEDMKEAFELAIKKAGGQSALARKLSSPAKKVSQQRLWHWLQVKGVCPPELVLQIEAITGVSRYSLRPDVFGEVPVVVSAA